MSLYLGTLIKQLIAGTLFSIAHTRPLIIQARALTPVHDGFVLILKFRSYLMLTGRMIRTMFSTCASGRRRKHHVGDDADEI